MALMTAARIIQILELKPCPEGGHFRETFRGGAGRARSISSQRAVSTRTGIGSMLPLPARPAARVPHTVRTRKSGKLFLSGRNRGPCRLTMHHGADAFGQARYELGADAGPHARDFKTAMVSRAARHR